MVMKDNLIYTAPWIIPINNSPIKDGAIVINREQIVEVGQKKQVKQDNPDCRVVDLKGIVMPALVNCHIHLELSYLQNEAKPARPSKDSSMVEWIEDLLTQRQKKGSNDIIINGIHDIIRDQYKSGVILMADIGNIPQTLPETTSQYPEICSILELLGPTHERSEAAINGLSASGSDIRISPHAPYSTSAQLISALKIRASEYNHVFSIHLAESADELELICNHQGPFRNFLEKRESWEQGMLGDSKYKGAVDYLNSLVVLDDKTLCVHCVHINEEEIKLVADSKAKVCLCPGSNEFLRVGHAPLERMLHHGILPSIGTDSIASNETLDMWREMQILRRNYPSVAPNTILAMSTLGGADSLQRGDSYGTLQRGKKPVFLEVKIDDVETMLEVDIFEELTSGGRPQEINWITPFKN